MDSKAFLMLQMKILNGQPGIQILPFLPVFGSIPTGLFLHTVT